MEHGRLNESNYGPCVSVWAPGEDVRSAHITAINAERPTSEDSGTSFSAPIVAGVAARILQQHPTWWPLQVWAEIFANRTTLTGNYDGDSNTDEQVPFIYINSLD